VSLQPRATSDRITRHDLTFNVLLDLDRQVLVVDPEGGHWVGFIVTRVPVSPEKPHGIRHLGADAEYVDSVGRDRRTGSFDV